MLKLFQIVLERNLADLRGAHVAGTVPVREELINAALNEEIETRRGPIQQFEVRVRENNNLQVGLRLTIGPFSRWFRPELIIDAQALRSQSPVLLFIIAQAHYGAAARLVALLSKGKLPAGVHIKNRQVEVDLGSLPQIASYR